ncbi:putative ribonuclease H-like domain-containing protein [Tanacetum coccineum]
MFQSLLSQLEIHGAGVSTEDSYQKFLRSLPASLSQVSLIMRTKPGVDSLSFDDLYNNLRVFEPDVKGSTRSSSSTQNVAFVSSSTSSTKDVDEFDLEDMDLKWQVDIISMRLKKFYKKTGRNLQFDVKEPVGFDKTKVECFNFHNTGHFARECRSKGNQERKRRDAGNTGYKAKDNRRRPEKQEEPKALVTLDGDGVDWTGHAEDEQENFALMAYSNSGSDTEVTSCSKECVESYAKLKKLYDEQRKKLGDASIEIQAYTQALKKVEAQLKLLAEAVKEKEELKTKLENFQSSSKGLSKLLNSQMSAKDKFGLGYGDQIHEGVSSYEDEVLESIFDSRSSDVEDSPVNDRFAKVEGMHAVPPPMIGIYMPPKLDFGIDESKFTYGPKQSKTSESDAKISDFASCESNYSVETLKYVPKPAVNEPKAVNKPKVWSDAPIIEEYDSDDSNDKYMIKPSKEQEKPSFAFINTVKHVKTPRETVKEQNTCSSNCDSHEKRLAKQVELNKQKGKGTGQGENRPVWNNVQRLNHQNKFVPKAVITKTGRFPVNVARQNLSNQAVSTSTARKDDPQKALKNKGIIDSGCSRHMTRNKVYLVKYQDYNGGLVTFGGSKIQITSKGEQSSLYRL